MHLSRLSAANGRCEASSQRRAYARDIFDEALVRLIEEVGELGKVHTRWSREALV
jgi:hypothetical protein